MSLYYCAGELGNLGARAASVTVSGASAQYPYTYLYDGRPGRPFMWSANGADKTITFDLNLLATSGTSDTPTVRTGERLKLDASGIGAGDTVTVQDALTGLYLQSDATWAGSAAAITNAGTLTFRVATSNEWPTTTLTVTVAGDTLANVTLYPAVNFASIHGHNLRSVVTPTLRSSTDNFGASDTAEATFTIARPAFYVYISTAVYRRYWRLKLGGTNTEIPYIGELWIGYAETAEHPGIDGWELAHDHPQVRQRTLAGQQHVAILSDDAPRMLTLDLELIGTSEPVEWLSSVWQRGKGGSLPMVIVPVAGETPVLHGRMAPAYRTRRVMQPQTNAQVVIEEDGFPVVGV